MVHLLPHWNWDNPELANRVMDEEGRIPVRTFSNAHSVELIVNGESQGVKTFTKKPQLMAGPTKKGQIRMNSI